MQTAGKRRPACESIFDFTTTNGFTKHSATARRPKFMPNKTEATSSQKTTKQTEYFARRRSLGGTQSRNGRKPPAPALGRGWRAYLNLKQPRWLSSIWGPPQECESQTTVNAGFNEKSASSLRTSRSSAMPILRILPISDTPPFRPMSLILLEN